MEAVSKVDILQSVCVSFNLNVFQHALHALLQYKQQLRPRRTEYHAKALVAKKRVTISSFPCVECKFVTKDYYDLKRHVKNAHPKYKFKCRDKKCPEVFFDRENRRRHWVRKFGKFLKSFV